MQSRFPAPPRRGQMSTRDDTRRSKEAPMQFEWQESRDSTFGLAGDERPQKSALLSLQTDCGADQMRF